MARIGGNGPTDRAWRGAVVLGLALIAGAFVFALLHPLVFGPCPCRSRGGRLIVVLASSRDLWIAVDAARYVAQGALGYVYESSPHLTSLPLFPILLAPVVALGDALGLAAPPAPMATMYFLVAPFMVALAAPLLHQVRGLVRDAGDRGPVLSLQVWMALLVAVPVLVVCGHGEDGLALLACAPPSGWPTASAGRRPGWPCRWRSGPSSGPCWPCWPPVPGGPGPGWPRPASRSRPRSACSRSRWTGPMRRRRCCTRPTIPGTGMPPCGSTPGRRR